MGFVAIEVFGGGCRRSTGLPLGLEPGAAKSFAALFGSLFGASNPPGGHPDF